MQRYRENVGVFDIVNEGNIEDVTVDINDEGLNIDFLLKIIQELPDRYRLVFNLYVLVAAPPLPGYCVEVNRIFLFLL